MLSNEQRENHVGANIRSLRDFHGEKLEDLAFSLDIDISDISRYENGKRYPNHKILEKIARHYCITLDELIYEDFSRLHSGFLQFTDTQKINEISDMLFPIVCSEQAMRDEWFQKAYRIHIRIFENLKKGISYSEKEMDECFTCYENSCKKNSTLESFANLCSWNIFFAFCLFLQSNPNIKYGIDLLHEKQCREKDFFKIYCMPSFDGMEDSETEPNEKIQSQWKELEERIVFFIRKLKESKIYADLAEYDIALLYILGLVKNQLTFEMNKKVGTEMMRTFHFFGNPYAEAYVKSLTVS